MSSVITKSSKKGQETSKCNLEREYRDCITQYGSTVYIGMAMGGSAL